MTGSTQTDDTRQRQPPLYLRSYGVPEQPEYKLPHRYSYDGIVIYFYYEDSSSAWVMITRSWVKLRMWPSCSENNLLLLLMASTQIQPIDIC